MCSIIIEHSSILQLISTLTCIKHLSEGAALLTRNASNAEEELEDQSEVSILVT